MRRRDLLRQCAFGAAAVTTAPMLNFGRCRLYAGTESTLSTRAVDLVQSSLVVDMLGLLTLEWDRLQRWHANPASFSQTDFSFLRNSGITTFHPAVDLNSNDPRKETEEWLGKWNRFIDAQPKKLKRITTSADLTQARSSGHIGILLGMQNSEHFSSPADVATFWAMGQRISQLTYNARNRIGNGCTATLDDGLSEFGTSIVTAMNNAGMMIDVSHAGERTTLETFEASTKPVLITHSNCKALVPHPRCKSDEVIRAMAKKGGVMGVTYVRNFLTRSADASLEDALDHFDHAIRIAGPEHLGIGSDTDLEGRDSFASKSRREIRGLNHPRRIYDLTEGLLRRGHSPADVRLILGANFQRAMAANAG